MVELQCPHCHKDIELENGAYGLFDCPHCNQEFEYESPTPERAGFELKSSLNMTSKAGIVLLIGSVIVLIAGLFLFKSGMSDFENTETECEDGLWVDNFADDRGCSTEGDYGFGSFCCGIILLTVAAGVGLSAIISLITGAMSGKRYVVVNQK